MDTKMKGLFKGLRYISQIFDSSKEPEMQIGFPTDVKHVAHIGWDGPTPAPNGPSWMNEFQSGMEGGQQNMGSSKWDSSGFSDSARHVSPASLDKPPSRPPRQHKSSFNEPGSPPHHDVMLTQHGGSSQRRHSSGSSSVGSPSHDQVQTGSRHGRKSRSTGRAESAQPSDAPPPAGAKQKSRRKAKAGGSSGGSVRRGRGPAGSPELGGAGDDVAASRPQRGRDREEGGDSF